jgi:hypothetical protein
MLKYLLALLFVFSGIHFSVHAAPGNSPAGRHFTLQDHVEKSTPIEKHFRHPETGMTVRLSTVFWNDSENENWRAYKEFTFFEVQLRKRGFVKDYRPACEWAETNRSGPTHCSIEGQVYNEDDRGTVIVIECNGRAGRQFDANWEGSPGSAIHFFDTERRNMLGR